MASPAATLWIDIRAATAALEKDLEKAARSFKGYGKQLTSVGDSLTKSLSLPLAAFGAAALKSANDFQKATQIISAGTGATGKKLKELEGVATNVFKSLPVSMQDAAQAVADLNTRTGLTGDALQGLSTTVLNLSKLAKTDLNETVRQSGILFKAWGVEVERQSTLLDSMFVASQQTGTGIATLMNAVAGADEVFQNVGYSLEEAIALMAQFEANGVGSEAALKGLTRAIKIMGDAGIKDGKAGLEQMFFNIRKAGDEIAAAALGVKYFGNAAGGDMADAIRDGIISVDELVQKMAQGRNAINDTARSTLTFSEQLVILKNGLETAFLPLGTALTTSLLSAGGAMTFVLKSLEDLTKWFDSLDASTQQNIVTFGVMATIIGPVIFALGQLATSFAGVIKGIVATGIAIKGLTIAMASPGGLLLAVVALNAAWAYMHWDEIAAGARRVANGAIELANMFIRVKNAIVDMRAELRGAFGLQDAFASGLNKIFGRAGFKIDLSKLAQARSGTKSKEFDFITEPIKVVSEAGDKAAEAVAKMAQQIKDAGKTAAVGTTGVNNLGVSLEDVTGKTKQATQAFEDYASSVRSLKVGDEIDRIKQAIDKTVSGLGDVKGLGSAANIENELSVLKKKLLDEEFEKEKKNLDLLSGEQRKQYEALINDKVNLEFDKYKNELGPKMIEVDKANHAETVGFWKGLMEDAITDTRFDWKEQMKKAAVEFIAEFITRMIEANIFASKSFGGAFSIVLDAISGSLGSMVESSGLGKILGTSTGGGAADIFGSIFGSGASAAGGEFIGPIDPNSVQGITQAGEAIAGAYEDVMGVFGGGPSTGKGGWLDSLMGGFSNSTATTSQSIAGYGGALYGVYQHGQDIGKSTSGTIQAVGAGGGAAVGAIFGGPFGSAIGAQIGGYIGDFIGGFFEDKLTPNEMSLKKFEAFVEDTLQKTLGKTFNFVLGNMERFADPNWSQNFWKDFEGKGAGTFNALGAAFEKMLGLEAGVGGQVGALLAANLAGADSEKSLNNIKLFLDSMGLSVEQLAEQLTQLGIAGTYSWHEIEVMNQELAKIPAQGLVGVGDLAGALQQVLESGGRGANALRGLRNIAVEAAEAGVENFDQLRESLAAAGYDAQTLDALFTALGQRGIDSMDELAGASDRLLGGVIADMESLGINWDKWTEAAENMNEAVNNLASEIRNLGQAIDALPKNTDVKINQEVSNSGGGGIGTVGNAKGAVLGFAAGGVINTRSYFQMQGGQLGMVGEAGPEAILPLRRVNGKLGVAAIGGRGGGQNYYFNIDATGAEAGVEQKILAMLESVKGTVVREAVEVMSTATRRHVL